MGSPTPRLHRVEEEGGPESWRGKKSLIAAKNQKKKKILYSTENGEKKEIGGESLFLFSKTPFFFLLKTQSGI